MAANRETPSCFLCDAKLASPQETWIVGSKRVPRNLEEGLKKVLGQKVCGVHVTMLQRANFDVFNQAKARENATKGAQTSLRGILNARGILGQVPS